MIENAVLKTEVFMKSPYLFLSRIIEPKSLKGISALYRGSTLFFYYPSINYAISIKNIYMPSKAEAYQMISDKFDKNMKNFNYTMGKNETIEGYPVVGLYHKAKGDKTYNQSGKTLIYSKFSFPLAGDCQGATQASLHRSQGRRSEAGQSQVPRFLARARRLWSAFRKRTAHALGTLGGPRRASSS